MAVERSYSSFSASVGGAVCLETAAMAPVSIMAVPMTTAVVEGAPVIQEMVVQATVVVREVGSGPQGPEETVEVVRLAPHEQVQQRPAERIVDESISQIMKESFSR